MNNAHTPTPQKLSTKWFEDFAIVSEDGEIEDWPEVARKLIEHAEACKIDEAQLESAGEEIERLRNSHDALVAQVAAMQAVCNAASICAAAWQSDDDEREDSMDEEFALQEALETYRAALKAVKGPLT